MLITTIRRVILVKLNKIGFSLTAAAISFGMMSAASAATNTNTNTNTNMIEQPKQIEIQVASTENVVTKNDLIKKLKEFFPKKFDFLSASDFYMSSGHYYPEDKTIRYDLNFSKTIQGKDVYGYISFVGDDLEIENFYYKPVNVADALFPAKVTKEEAQKIATDFIKKFPNSEQYQFDKNSSDMYSYYSSQLLTEPIRYSFTFVRTKNQVELPDQQIQVGVLGNGEIVDFYSNSTNRNAGFDDVQKKKAESEILEKIKENLQVQLQYQINYEYRSDKPTVELVYNPTGQFTGVHALTGEWQTPSGFVQNLPEAKKIEPIVPKALAPRQNGITVEEAKSIAEKLLKIDSDEVTLTIDSIGELKDYNGMEVYDIQYSYNYKNGGHGTSLAIDKNTGEIVQYYDIKADLLSELGKEKNKTKITSSQALSKAINYLKEWAPSRLHEYALPISEPNVDERMGVYNFSFPRIVNGITVAGDNINVSIKFDGSLSDLYVSHQEFENWPSTDSIISKEEALQRFKDELSLKLQYSLQGTNEKDQHYSLVYAPVFNDKGTGTLDAASGEWTSQFEVEEHPTIEHPTAEQELNYLIQNNILEVKDSSSFNADAAITKGDALKTLVKSLTYFYEEYNITYDDQPHPQTYENIGPDHPYYKVVEQAVSMGILNPDNSELNINSQITREELAVWYIRALGLEQAASHSDIYKLKIKDAKDVKYTGYVALANALEILPAENGLFKPQEKVTYAELAVSTIHLAHKVYESRVSGYRYY